VTAVKSDRMSKVIECQKKMRHFSVIDIGQLSLFDISRSGFE